MWAGGDLSWHADLRLGTPATRTSTIKDIAEKSGRTGSLAFVTVIHEIHQAGTLCLSEAQTLVYRQMPEARATVPAPPVYEGPSADVRTPLTFGPVALFRYSALTLNGHRIHYDADYSRRTLGHPGLIVHGPLLAQTLIDLARAQGPLDRFAFRARSPLFAGQEAFANWRSDGSMWVEGAEGRLIMTAEAG